MIISLYAGGMTLRDIQFHLASTIGTELSHETISKVIDDGSAANLALVALPGSVVGVLYERDKYRRLSFQRVELEALIDK